MKRTWTCILTAVLGLCPVFLGAQDFKSEKAAARQANREAVAASIEAHSFEFNADWAIPASGRSVSLTPGYKLIVHGDSATAYLPFYGRAYSLPYGEGGGINVEDEMKNFKVLKVFKKKKSYTDISFDVSDRGDTFTFRLMVFPDGGTSMSVTSIHRAAISYRGILSPLPEKKE